MLCYNEEIFISGWHTDHNPKSIVFFQCMLKLVKLVVNVGKANLNITDASTVV
jgi:hypothetical protein